MDWLKELWDRLFTHWQSSLTGALLVLFVFLHDHGIDISQDNQKTIILKVLALAAGLFKIYGKDAPATESDVWGNR